jgi:ParB/RepB/Spo0J family partition protein
MAARTKRTEVPAPEAAASSTTALDELTGGAQRVTHGEVDVDLIDPDPRNPEHRSVTIDEELLEDICHRGVVQEVLLRPNPAVEGRWLAIDGHRRVTHSRAAGRLTVPAALFPPTSDLDALRDLIRATIHREDLSFTEQAQLVQGFLDLGVDERDLPGELHKSAEWVRSRRAVARLPKAAQKLVDAKQLTLEQVNEIDAFADDEKTYTKLLEKVGSYDFPWALQSAKDDRKRAARMLEHLAILEVLAVPIVRTGKALKLTGDAPTHEVLGTFGPTEEWGLERLTEARVKALAKKRPDLAAIEAKNKYFKLVAPVAVGKKESAAAARKRAAEEAARAAAAAAREAALEASGRAHTLRAEFLCSFLRGERRLTADQIAELASVTVEFVSRGQHLYTWGDNAATKWLTLAGLTGDFGAVYASLPAGSPLVLLLAQIVEHTTATEQPALDQGLPHTLDGNGWARGLGLQGFGDVQQCAPSYYALLQRLGYTPSDAERAALANMGPSTDVRGSEVVGAGGPEILHEADDDESDEGSDDVDDEADTDA